MSTEEYNSGGSKTPVVINEVALPPLEVNGQRVLTLSMIDKVHGRTEGTAGRNFREHRSRLVEGKHFDRMSAAEFRRRFPGEISRRATEEMILLTERGYLMLVKAFRDDLAWQVQDSLVESYFVKQRATIRIANPNTAAVRECRLTQAMNMKILGMLGIRGNQAVLAASRGTKALTGIDPLAVMGVSHAEAPQNEALLSPTEIGRRVEMSAREVNSVLCELGLQSPFRDAKGHLYYDPTEAGREAGAVMQDTGKKHGNGVPVRQLKWGSSICDTLSEQARRH